MTDNVKPTDRRYDETAVEKSLIEVLLRVGAALRSIRQRWFSPERLLTRCCLLLLFAGTGLVFVARSVPPQVWDRYSEIGAMSLALSGAAAYFGRREIAGRVSGNTFREHRLSPKKYLWRAMIPAMVIAVGVNYLDPKLALLSHPISLAIPTSFFVSILSMIAWLVPYEKKHGPVFVVNDGTVV